MRFVESSHQHLIKVSFRSDWEFLQIQLLDAKSLRRHVAAFERKVSPFNLTKDRKEHVKKPLVRRQSIDLRSTSDVQDQDIVP